MGQWWAFQEAGCPRKGNGALMCPFKHILGLSIVLAIQVHRDFTMWRVGSLNLSQQCPGQFCLLGGKPPFLLPLGRREAGCPCGAVHHQWGISINVVHHCCKMDGPWSMAGCNIGASMEGEILPPPTWHPRLFTPTDHLGTLLPHPKSCSTPWRCCLPPAVAQHSLH